VWLALLLPLLGGPHRDNIIWLKKQKGGFRAVTLNTGYEPKSYMRVEEAAILLILSWGVSYYLRNVIEFLAYVITTVYWGDASLP
jgi:hypothetical protein